MAGKKRSRKGLVFLGLILLLGGAGYGYYSYLEKSSLSTLSGLRSEGIPTSVGEYREALPHDGRDGSTALDRAQAALAKLSQEQRVQLDSAEPPPPASRPSADGSQDLMPQFTKLFREAASAGWYDYVPSPDRVLSGDEPDALYRDTCFGARLLAKSAQMERPQRNIDAQFVDLYYAFRLIGQVAESAVGSDSLTYALVSDRIPVDGWKKLLAAKSQDMNAVNAAGRLLGNIPALPSLRHLVDSQFAAGLTINDRYETFQKWAKLPEPKDWKERMRLELQKSDAGRRMRRSRYLAAWQRLYESLPDDQEAWTAYRSAVEKVAKEESKPGPAEPYLGFEGLPKLFELWAQRYTERRLAALSVEVLKYGVEHGELPTSPAFLKHSTTDPFTGNTLLYKQEGKKFTLYSAGPNRADDQGSGDDIAHSYTL